MIENELWENDGRCTLCINGKLVPVRIDGMKMCADEVTMFTGHFRELEPERLYITTASRPDDRYMDRYFKNMLNSTYGKDAYFKPKFEINSDDLYRIRKGAERDGMNTRMKIEKVIFNDPATIVFWKDGTKTVVKAQDEAFDPEKGLAMAISKKALGNEGNYFEEFKKWLPEESVEVEVEAEYKVEPENDDVFPEWSKYMPVYNTKKDAMAVLNDMHDILKEYGYVTVMDMYDLSDMITFRPYRLVRHGWTNLDDVTVQKQARGWIVDLPVPIIFKRDAK